MKNTSLTSIYLAFFLTVGAAVLALDILVVEDNSATPRLSLSDTGNLTISSNDAAGPGLRVVQQGTGKVVSFFAGGTEVVTVANGGKVGLGATSPNEVLTLDGVISLKELAAPAASPGYGKIYAKPPGVGLDSFTKLLIHADDPNGSTTFVDAIGSHSPVAVGNALGSTAQSKFGTASMSFSGGAGIPSAHHVFVSSSTDWAFGAGDFTVDFWAYISGSVANGFFMNGSYNDSPKTNGVDLGYDSNTNFITLVLSAPGTWGGLLNTSIPYVVSTGAWHHWALVRTGTTFLIFVDGVQAYSSPTIAAAVGSGDLFIGSKDAGAAPTMTGYIDEFRVSKGIARWVSAFTPPSAPVGSGGLFYMDSNGNEFALTPGS